MLRTVYETALKLVFYDEPTFGPYRGWLNAIRADLRHFSLEANLWHTAARYCGSKCPGSPFPSG